MKEISYIDKKGDEIFVSSGLGDDKYGSFRKSKYGGLHRVKSPAMPMVSSKIEAEKNLRLWAQKKGLRIKDDCCEV